MVNDLTSDLYQLRPYQPDKFKAQFEASQLYSLLPRELIPVWSRSGTYDPEHHASTTPRWRHMHGYFCMASFYYLGFVMDGNPARVADIGCGENPFKPYYPQIIGYDPFIDSADHRAYFDDTFVAANQAAFDCAIACNSLHFTDLEEFPDMLGMLSSLVKPGGMVHATANATRFLDAANPSGVHNQAECVAMAMRIDGMVRSLDLDLIVVDQCYDGIYPGDLEFNNGILGNLRLVFRV